MTRTGRDRKVAIFADWTCTHTCITYTGVRYVGGKSKIAKRLAAPIVANRRGRPIWEPFCGGLGMSSAWGGGALLLTDACVPLIEMYRAYQSGWRPPTYAVTPDERNAALDFPDTDPRKAFFRFACGVGGWSSGTTHDGLDWNGDTLSAQAARSLARTFVAISGAVFDVCDFITEPVDPAFAQGIIIYCDPPYRGTEGYAATGAFDHDAFVDRARAWASAGAEVYVSEYEFPAPVVLELDRARHMGGRGVVRERLFRV